MACTTRNDPADLQQEGYLGFADRMERDGETLGARIRLWHERWQNRRRLAEMEPHLLDDIGITREQALAEARKPFWKA